MGCRVVAGSKDEVAVLWMAFQPIKMVSYKKKRDAETITERSQARMEAVTGVTVKSCERLPLVVGGHNQAKKGFYLTSVRAPLSLLMPSFQTCSLEMGKTHLLTHLQYFSTDTLGNSSNHPTPDCLWGFPSVYCLMLDFSSAKSLLS